ncbi:hypothetical protein GS399_14725 [Pedobacter sp. HMF7647]|uniref:DUF5723 domain-containing protein n=1 Tax=Hufsiella arboris TaxID=2695275 RepID=A0A7K1YCR9_9SPHI|nr:DUF5723 family protein [Hufsiella arboris]MXV52230.1 hypothetical protein [Hufsiella arboris]
MKCKGIIISAMTFAVSLSASAQQFALYNTRTLYDAFENPSQKAFYADSSRKYAFNFFIPSAGFNGVFTGPAQTAFKTLVYRGGFSGASIDVNNTDPNKFFGNLNSYLLMFRVFKSIKLNRELGFAWQVKAESTIDNFSNQTFAILQDYRYFPDGTSNDIFNDKGYAQTYHQFSFNYREDLNKQIGLGIKIGYLSGIAYTRLDINQSSLTKNLEADAYDMVLKGGLQSSFNYGDFGDITYAPGFTNPGAALTASANFKLRGGWFLLTNLKDIGFIHWNNESYQYYINTDLVVENASENNGSKYLFNRIYNSFKRNYTQKSFTTMINGKAEVLLNKDFDRYQPNLLVSKNLFYKGFDIALMNTYKTENFNFSLSTAYSAENFQVGGVAMYKTPNAEFFLGTDNVLKTYYTTKGLITNNENIGNGYTGASFYLGFGLKFGKIMEHDMNSSNIPGFGSRGDDSGFFGRLFGRKSKN